MDKMSTAKIGSGGKGWGFGGGLKGKTLSTGKKLTYYILVAAKGILHGRSLSELFKLRRFADRVRARGGETLPNIHTVSEKKKRGGREIISVVRGGVDR